MVGLRHILFLFLARASFAHICDVCDCQPNRNEVFSITCDCAAIKHLHFTSSMMMGIESAAMVLIRNCQIVSIERNSFSQLTKLDTLGIQNCLHLYLASGAFSSLNSLLINNVQDISFGEMALMGARGVKNININNSNITRLPKYSLFDIKGMDGFSFNRVNIGKIERDAVGITATSISMENTKINHTDTNGLSLQAQKVMIKNSELPTTEVNPVNIKTEFHTRLLENNFTGNFQMNITSPFAEFFGNHFEFFSSQVLDNIQTSRLMNNFFSDADFERMLKGFDRKDFHDNEFKCRCGMNLLNFTRNSYNYEILKNNFCMTNCSLSLFEFEVESHARCMKDHTVDANSYCTFERTLRNNPRVTTVGTRESESGAKNFSVPELQPRFLDLDENTNSTAGQLLKQNFILFSANFIMFLIFYVL